MASPPSASPSDAYAQRQRAREATVAQLAARHRSLGYLRLLLVLSFLALAWFSAAHHGAVAWLLAVPAIFFVVTAAYHARVLRRFAQAELAVDYYRAGLARIEDRWAGTNPRDDRPAISAASLYAADLNITGRDGLFELLCAARTRIGEDTLLRWLLHPAPRNAVLERQAAIAELRENLDLRESMATFGSALKIGLHPDELQRWAEAPDALPRRDMRWPALLLCLAFLFALYVWFAKDTLLPLIAVVVVEWFFARSLKQPVLAVFGGAEQTSQDLQLLSVLLQRLETETFHAPLLAEIKRKLSSHNLAGSRAIARLRTLTQYKDSLSNPLVRAFDVPLMYSVQLAFAIQRWRTLHGAAVRSWLEAIGEMEPLLSLATYSYEHPGDPFPSFVEGAASFDAEALGHPLIPAAKCVRNDVRLCDERRVLLISGSNMSGKSTLLRAVGVNTALAMCGAPVRARSLKLTPLETVASLVVNDSLQSGQSRFYAEIDRLQKICAAAESGDPAVLFLLDELLQGTNSLDRLKGAEGVTRSLVDAGAIGLIATHDLSLAALDADGRLRLDNAHFQDEIIDGRMSFDFKLHQGIVTRSNGVELMRLIGLNV